MNFLKLRHSSTDVRKYLLLIHSEKERKGERREEREGKGRK
jgi:hypothetical protein